MISCTEVYKLEATFLVLKVGKENKGAGELSDLISLRVQGWKKAVEGNPKE